LPDDRATHHYGHLFEALEQAVVVYEVRDGGRSILVRDANPAALKISRRTRAEVVGKPIVEAFPGADSFGLLASLREAARTGRTVRQPLALYEDERVSRWSEAVVYALPGGELAAVFTDETERFRAEQDLATSRERLDESETWLRTILNAAPVGIGMVVDRVFQWASQRLTEILGYAEEELVGRSALMIYPDEAEFRRVGEVKYRQIAEQGWGEMETRWRRQDGRIIDVLLSSSALVPGDVARGTIFTALDITERKRAERERIELESHMRQAQKLESLGVLAGGIAHDFNNLLMAIMGNVDLALLDLTSVSPGREHLLEIQATALRAADLCNQMLAYSGRGKFVIEPLDVSELVREMAHLLDVSVSKNARLRYQLADDLPAVAADATQIRQIVMNLIINASEAVGGSPGVITVTTGVADCDREYLHGCVAADGLAAGRYVFFEVADTGIGMDEETVARVFDPFFTTKFTGRGLGMAAVLGIVRGHRGAIRVFSEPDGGTTFKVLLPIQDGPELVARTRTEPADEDWRGEGTVLLVDDEEMLRTLGTKMLKRMGFEVLTAADGREAISVFQDHADIIVCVILDLTMPHMDGAQAFRELRRLRPDARILMSSGFTEQEVTQRFAGQGLAGFIQKPYQMDQLRAELRKVIAEEEG
jgi:two-component system cell cycle sensor histidine kinase/response regulator CckA